MAVIETWIKTDLKSIVKVNMFHGILFSQDNMANLIGVELLDGSEPATVTGSVSANVLRADGTTVAVAGTLSGNKASVTLPQAAYAVPGMLAVVIKLTDSSTVTTIGAIQSIVYRASTDTIIDPGTIIPSVQDLIAAIDAAVDSIPPDYSALTAEVGDLKTAFVTLDEELNGVNLIKNGTAIARNTGSAGSPNFVFSNGDFKIRRASSSVGNGATIYFPVPENATGKKYICELNVSGGSASVENNFYVTGYTSEPSAYNTSATEVYKSYSSFASIIDSVSFTIGDEINYIGFSISVKTNQSDYISGNVFICSADEIGRLREIENEIAEKVNKEEFQSINNITPLVIDAGWVIGGLSDAGNETVGTTRARSAFIPVNVGESLNIAHESYYWSWFRYNTLGVFQEKSSFSAGWSQDDGVLSPAENSLYRIMIRNPVNSSDVVLADIDVIVSHTSKAVKALQDAEKNTNSLFGFEFVTPPIVNICGGIEQNFYYQNMLMGFNTKKAYCIDTTAKTTNFDDFARLSPSENTSLQNNGFKVRLYPYNKNGLVSSDTISYNVVPKSAGTGLTKKILLIGDSLTFNQPMSKHLVDDLLASDAMTVSLIGTLGTAPYNREGRSGWSVHDYVSGYEHGDSFTNAFWNPSTEKFDFSYYMSNNDFSGVDYVFINLGTNLGGNTVASMTDDLEEMVTSIHAYDANIRVGVWTPPPRALMGNGFLTDNDNTLLRVKEIINKFKGRTGERIYVVPVTLNVDPYHDFPYETVNVSSRNSSFQMVVATDRTHPADAGYWKMADVIYNYIKYFGSLDAT